MLTAVVVVNATIGIKVICPANVPAHGTVMVVTTPVVVTRLIGCVNVRVPDAADIAGSIAP